MDVRDTGYGRTAAESDIEIDEPSLVPSWLVFFLCIWQMDKGKSGCCPGGRSGQNSAKAMNNFNKIQTHNTLILPHIFSEILQIPAPSLQVYLFVQ